MLPSLTDALFIIFLLVPGFLSFQIFNTLTKNISRRTQFEETLWTLVFTTGIYLVSLFLLVNLRGVTFNSPEDSIGILLSSQGLPTILGVMFSIPIFLTLFQSATRSRLINADTWNKFIYDLSRVKLGSAVTIITRDGSEYKGFLKTAGFGNESKEVLLSHPVQILRNKKMKVVTEFSPGEELYFHSNDIARIIRLESER